MTDLARWVAGLTDAVEPWLSAQLHSYFNEAALPDSHPVASNIMLGDLRRLRAALLALAPKEETRKSGINDLRIAATALAQKVFREYGEYAHDAGHEDYTDEDHWIQLALDLQAALLALVPKAANNVVACVNCKRPVEVTALNAIRCDECAALVPKEETQEPSQPAIDAAFPNTAGLLDAAKEARTETPDYPDLLDLIEELAAALQAALLGKEKG